MTTYCNKDAAQMLQEHICIIHDINRTGQFRCFSIFYNFITYVHLIINNITTAQTELRRSHDRTLTKRIINIFQSDSGAARAVLRQMTELYEIHMNYTIKNSLKLFVFCVK